jgi:hypothetical protein
MRIDPDPYQGHHAEPSPSDTLKESLMDKVVAFYLDGEDFNGLPLFARNSTPDEVWLALKELVADGSIQVVSSKDFENPHIRPWANRRSKADQVESIEAVRMGNANSDEDRICLYPTPKAMESRIKVDDFIDEPYRRAQALGHGDLELRFFSFDAMEGYRNDPRYHFTYWDYGLNFGIGDDAFMDDSELEKDKFASAEVGFAYMVPISATGQINRRVCLFLHDLANLSPEHQRRIETYEIKGAELADLKPHAMWYASQMGLWPDGIGIFEKMLLEMVAINTLTSAAFGEPLFKSTERPREYGWVLRASQKEWDDFIHLSDKLFSENINVKLLDSLKSPKLTEDGNQIGSISRLQWVLENVISLDPVRVRSLLQTFRDIREARQKPAHALRQNVSDASLVRKQRDLLVEIVRCVENFRTVFAELPANSAWVPDQVLSEDVYSL